MRRVMRLIEAYSEQNRRSDKAFRRINPHRMRLSGYSVQQGPAPTTYKRHDKKMALKVKYPTKSVK